MNREKKLYGSMNYLIYICPHHIKDVDMNKKSNVSLICGGVKLKSKS